MKELLVLTDAIKILHFRGNSVFGLLNLVFIQFYKDPKMIQARILILPVSEEWVVTLLSAEL